MRQVAERTLRRWWTWPITTGLVLAIVTAADPGTTRLAASDRGTLRGDGPAPGNAAIASFAVRYGNVESRYRINLANVMPGDSLRLSATGDSASGPFSLSASAGRVQRRGPRAWVWHGAQQPGLVRLTVTDSAASDSIVVQTFVLVPRSQVKDGVLNGYRIGKYPRVPLRDIYRPPPGFIEVTPENVDTFISPHFRLRQFVCKQVGDYPKYVVLDPFLLLKLELILRRVQEAGHSIEGLFVMSGYRTPYYNQLIRNSEWSRHKWGAAADIFIDENPRDGVMDDLNGDGRIDVKDADVLARIIDAESNTSRWTRFLGGLGIYRTKPNHGPFVHIDIRGRKARWRAP